MKATKIEFSTEVANEIEQLRNAAGAADKDLRVLRELEMGWVAGGSDPVIVW